jgi:hypothetical protein
MSSNQKKTESDHSLFAEKWHSTCLELRSAFHTWDKLHKLENALSPDEKKLQELKALIQDIKDQIKDFNTN